MLVDRLEYCSTFTNMLFVF